MNLFDIFVITSYGIILIVTILGLVIYLIRELKK
jgi:hypothetical protein